MNNIKFIFLTAFFTGYLPTCGMLGCKRAAVPVPPPPPSSLEVRAEADPVINRDPAGNPLSVVVHLYQLKERTGFSRLTFDLAAGGRPETDTLGGDFLGRTELTMVPGGQHASTQELLPGTRFIGIVALFRAPDPHYWRYLVSLDQLMPLPAKPARKPKPPVAAPANPRLDFRLRECSLALPDLRPEPIPGQPENGLPACPGETSPAGRVP